MTQAERFLTLSLAEVLGRIAGAVMSEGVLTSEKKLEIARSMNDAGQALGTKTLADLLGVSALSLAPYTPAAAPVAAPPEPLTSALATTAETGAAPSGKGEREPTKAELAAATAKLAQK